MHYGSIAKHFYKQMTLKSFLTHPIGYANWRANYGEYVFINYGCFNISGCFEVVKGDTKKLVIATKETEFVVNKGKVVNIGNVCPNYHV